MISIHGLQASPVGCHVLMLAGREAGGLEHAARDLEAKVVSAAASSLADKAGKNQLRHKAAALVLISHRIDEHFAVIGRGDFIGSDERVSGP